MLRDLRLAPVPPALDAAALQHALREALRPLRDEFDGRVAFRSVDIDTEAGATLARDGQVLNIPALSIWLRGRCWHTVIRGRPVDELRWHLGEAVRLSASDWLEIYVRESDLDRLSRWGPISSATSRRWSGGRA